MATLTKIAFERNDTLYELAVDFEDEKIIEDLIVFNLEAQVTTSDKAQHKETLSIEINWDKYKVTIASGNEILKVFEFSELDVRVSSEDGSEFIPGMEEGELKDGVYDTVSEGIDEGISRIIDAMPVPDPIFGCLIKAGISSVVGQAIACNEVRGNYIQESNRFWQIVKCLREHLGGVASRTLWRTARCMIRMGF